MQAIELRIGNYLNEAVRTKISRNIAYYEIKKIHSLDIHHLETFPESKAFEPIPLTEEWLLKFGFKHQNKYNLESNLYSKKLNSKYYFTIYSKTETLDFKTKFIGWKVLNIAFDLKIDFVHQLQNLYFALTNEELIINK